MKKIAILFALMLVAQNASSEVAQESTHQEENYSFTYDTEDAKRNIANEGEQEQEQKPEEEPKKEKKSYFKEMKYWKY